MRHGEPHWADSLNVIRSGSSNLVANKPVLRAQKLTKDVVLAMTMARQDTENWETTFQALDLCDHGGHSGQNGLNLGYWNRTEAAPYGWKRGNHISLPVQLGLI